MSCVCFTIPTLKTQQKITREWDLYFLVDIKKSSCLNSINFVVFSAGVSKLRPADQLRLAKVKSTACEHVFILNRIRPAKEKPAACDHVNVVRRTKLYLS